MTDNKILKAKHSLHKGMLFGILSNGGSFNVGNIQIEVIAKEGNFRTVQVYEYAFDGVVEKQGWVKPKVVKEKVEVEKKVEEQLDLGVENTSVKKW